MPPYDDKLKEDQHRYFYGLLDELALFNDVLSETELEDIRQDTVAAHIGSLGSKVSAYWPMDEEDPGKTVLDFTGKVPLKLGYGWEGYALIVPPDSIVENNLFFQNGINSQNDLPPSNLTGDPKFILADGGAIARYALESDSPAGNTASDGLNIGARQPVSQTITFEAEGHQFTNREYGDKITLGGSSDSGLPLTFEITKGEGEINGGKLTVASVGEITILAKQAGDSNYFEATPVSASFTVGKATVKVTPSDTVRGIGGENPEFELEYKGLLLDDIPADIDSPPTAVQKPQKFP